MKKIRDGIEGEMSIAAGKAFFFVISRKCCSLDIGEINEKKTTFIRFYK